VGVYCGRISVPKKEADLMPNRLATRHETEELEEIKRHFGVVAESLRSDIQEIAEGHAVLRHDLQSQA
jgi:hypothetical protein